MEDLFCFCGEDGIGRCLFWPFCEVDCESSSFIDDCCYEVHDWRQEKCENVVSCDCDDYGIGCCFSTYCACFITCCCSIPICFCILTFLISLGLFLVCFTPPLAIIVMAAPCLRAEEYEVFEFLEKKRERADPSDKGHKDPWEILQSGPVRAFGICLFLCLLGWFPGIPVLFH
eukprot:gene1883-1024_t